MQVSRTLSVCVLMPRPTDPSFLRLPDQLSLSLYLSEITRLCPGSLLLCSSTYCASRPKAEVKQGSSHLFPFPPFGTSCCLVLEEFSAFVQFSSCLWASFVAQLVKNLPAMWESCVQSLGWEDPLETGRLPTPVFWPGEFHGLYSQWGGKESDTTEQP